MVAFDRGALQGCARFFGTSNSKISSTWLGRVCGTIMLALFIVIHMVGILHVLKGPDENIGYGCFGMRLHWEHFGTPELIRS